MKNNILALGFLIVCCGCAFCGYAYADEDRMASEFNRINQAQYEKQHYEMKIDEQRQAIAAENEVIERQQQEYNGYTPMEKFETDYGDCYACGR